MPKGKKLGKLEFSFRFIFDGDSHLGQPNHFWISKDILPVLPHSALFFFNSATLNLAQGLRGELMAQRGNVCKRVHIRGSTVWAR